MKFSKTSSESNVTVIEIQRHAFASSLYKEMNALEKKAEERNSMIRSAAREYLNDGFGSDDCVDLLILDGYPSQLARECVASCSNAQPIDCEDSQKWDFTFKDSYGKLWDSREIGQSVSASTEEEAVKIASMIISDGENTMAQIVEISKSDV